MDWETATKELQKKLDPANVKKAPAGKFGDYVDGHHVVSEANRIFGHNGWSYEIMRLSQSSMIEITTDRGPQVRVSYLCTVKVWVDGTFKEGSAVGMGAGKPDNIGDVIESAVKEAETDALKRALRTYGNTFGLALYDKTREDVGIDLPPFDHGVARDKIKQAIEDAATIQELGAIWRDSQTPILRLKAEKPPMYLELEKAKDTQKEALQPKEEAF
jgi:DNA recombination protein Rad52